MANEILAFVSLIIAGLALLLTLWQNILTRKALQVQALLSLKEMENENYPVGLYAIVSLKSYSSYNEFTQNESTSIQKAIYDTVDYLNFTARLVEEGHLPRQTVWSSYFWAYRKAREKLYPWWFEGQRKNNFRRFNSFNVVSQRIALVTDKQIEKFNKKHYPNNPS